MLTVDSAQVRVIAPWVGKSTLPVRARVILGNLHLQNMIILENGLPLQRGLVMAHAVPSLWAGVRPGLGLEVLRRVAYEHHAADVSGFVRMMY